MDRLTCLFTLMAIPFCASKELECLQRNASCDAIKITDGYQYSWSAPDGTEVEVYYNETLIAHVKPFQNDHTNEVVRLDNNSVITKQCLRNLRLKCIVPSGENLISERCFEYEVTDKETVASTPPPVASTPPPVASTPPPWGIIFAGVAGVAGVARVVLFISGILYWRFCISRTTNPREGISQAERGAAGQTRRLGESEFQEVQEGIRDNLDNQQPGPDSSSFNRDSISLREPSDPDPHGTDDVQAHTLGSLQLYSIDPGTDGKTPEALHLDCNLSNGGTQLSNDREPVDLNSATLSVPDGDTASNHRVVNRNLRDDPGGLNGSTGKDVNIKNRGIPGDWTPGDQSLKEQEEEGEPLLSDKRAHIQDLNMTGEPIASVNKRGLDPDPDPDPNPVSRCSIALDKGSSDVESTSYKMNRDVTRHAFTSHIV
ncbi:uncharacterized protein [Centroberyx affinis]|uniref:uncharacterized protein n=1 Tax=Centroberyx affinis TaxID=166261 RepID=UPI003A5C3C9D